MVVARYVLSFSAGGLLYHESVVVAEKVLHAQFDWNVALRAAAEDNLLQTRTASTAKRKLREIRNRLQTLSDDELRLLAEGSRQEQKWVLWLACCLRYQLVADFAREVLRPKYLQLDLSIEKSDVERFIDDQTLWHDELERLAPSTRAKLQTVMMRMLRESELISKEGVLLPPLFSERLTKALLEDSRDHLLLFPVPVPE